MFQQDKSFSNIGEAIATVAVVKHENNIHKIIRPDHNCANSKDLIICDTFHSEACFDFKIDRKSGETRNFVAEIISMFRIKHLKWLKNNKNKYDKYNKIFQSRAYNETFDLLIELISQLNQKGELNKFTQSEKGWAIKDCEPSRSIVVFNCSNMNFDDKTKLIVNDFYKSLCCLKQDIGPEQISQIKNNHNKLFNDLKIKEYSLFFVNKKYLYDFILDASHTRAINAYNGSYQTLSLLIPLNKLYNKNYCSKHLWKS